MSALEESFSCNKLGPFTKPIRMKVVARAEKVATYTSGSEEKKCLSVVFCDGHTSVRGLCYDPKDFPKLQVGSSVVVRDIIRKVEEQRKTVVLTRSTKVFLTSNIEVAEELAEAGKALLNLPDAEFVDVRSALGSPLKKRVSVRGKIVQEDQEIVKQIRGVDTTRKTIVIEDESGRARVTLWRDAINKDTRVGDHVTVTNVVTNVYHNETSLTTTGRSECKKADVPLVEETLNVTGVCVDGNSVSLLTEEDNVVDVPAELLVQALPADQNPELLTQNGSVKMTVERKGTDVISVALLKM